MSSYARTVVGILLAWACCGVRAGEERPPNIVILYADDKHNEVSRYTVALFS